MDSPGVVKLKSFKVKTQIQLPTEKVSQEISLSETIEITQSKDVLRIIPKRFDDDECEMDSGLAPIMCDDEGPDFSLMTKQGKVSLSMLQIYRLLILQRSSILARCNRCRSWII
jgi:hypothetical protein